LPGKPASQLRRELGLERIVKLASNEGPLGPFPAALEALAETMPQLNRYPERGLELTERLAARHGLRAERVAPGNGADAVIGHLALAYLRPGDEAVMSWPSFVSHHLSAVKMGARPVHVPLDHGACDLDALAAAVGPATRIVYVCSPNNPTGGMVGREPLARFLDAIPEGVLVVIDAAYHEYVDDPEHADAVAEHGDRANVVVLRTFSKIYGLAGLRIGYAVGPAPVCAALAKVRRPFDLTAPAQVAAVASVGESGEIMRRRAMNAEGLTRLESAVRAHGFDPVPSVGNFLYVDTGSDASDFYERLLREGIIVRPLAGFGSTTAIRVSVGTPDEIDAFAAAHDRVLARA
jgi:histidinol-phosphate aminotransferase